MRWVFGMSVVLALACGGTPAPPTEIDASLIVGGQAFEPDVCHNGNGFAFVGIHLEDSKTGVKLRLLPGDGESTNGFVITRSKATGYELTDCGAMTHSPDGTEVDGIPNVSGTAQVSCGKGIFAVEGSVTYAHCH